MDISNILMLLGGLALFLFGIDYMGSSLKKVAGSKMEGILERLTANRFLGVLLGTFVTAVIQSSSATTVMVVGFVNSGIMKLGQAIGVVMGANIGTTATGWILSLSGVDSKAGGWASLLSASTITYVCAFIGIAMLMFAKKQDKKQVGGILLGFSTLMFGMEVMKDAVSPLTENPAQFESVVKYLANPAIGLIVGIIFTAIIQSASASVGVLQALSVTGLISFDIALPLVLGMNIGACMPVMLSAIGANKNGKRTALVYLYFNILGTIIFMAAYYILRMFVPFPWEAADAPAMNTVSIAILNTVYKVASTIVLLPFTKGIEKLVCLTVRDKKVDPNDEDADAQEDVTDQLDERFLNYPPLAVERCRFVTNKMAEKAHKNMIRAIGLLTKWDDLRAVKINAREESLDLYEDKLGTYLVKLSRKELNDRESKEVNRDLHAIGDLERIGDHAINILEVAQEIHDKGITFSGSAQKEIEIITEATLEIMDKTFDAFINGNIEEAIGIEALEEVIDLIRSELKSRHIDRLSHGLCTVELGFIFTDLLTNYERVADHCSNLGAEIVSLSSNNLDTHEYLYKFKHEDGSFVSGVEHYKDVYFSQVEAIDPLAEVL